MRLALFLAIHGISSECKTKTCDDSFRPSPSLPGIHSLEVHTVLYGTSIIDTAPFPLSLVASGSGIFLTLFMMVMMWAVLPVISPRCVWGPTIPTITYVHNSPTTISWGPVHLLSHFHAQDTNTEGIQVPKQGAGLPLPLPAHHIGSHAWT